MEFKVPDWLNKEFISDALQNGKVPAGNKSKIIVDTIDVKKAADKGDNFMSDVFRAAIKYRKPDETNTQLNTSLIIKSPKFGGIADYLIQMGILQKEERIYKDYIPKLNNIFGEEKILTPKLLNSSKEHVLVLEDLTLKGYVMANRRDQLDYDHTVLALKSLASFHAASVRIHEDEPELVKSVGKEVFCTEMMAEMYKQFVNINFKVIAQEFKDDSKLKRYVSNFLAHCENAWDKLVEMMKPRSNTINVLNHGDFWINNFLFRYDGNNKPIDIKQLDFQLSRFARPSLDITYFFYSSVQEEVRIKNWDILLKIYLEELNRCLEKYGTSQRLTELELKSMMDDCEFLGYFVSLSLFPAVLADPKDGLIDMTEVLKDQLTNIESMDNNPLKGYYRSEKFRKIIVDRLAIFETKEWF